MRDLVLSALTLIAALCALEFALRSEAVFERLPLPRPYYSYDLTRRLWYLDRLGRERGHVDLVFVGSSIVRAAFDPKHFDARLAELGQPDLVSFNGGMSATFPNATRFYVEHMWLPRAHPRFVLHGVREAELATRNLGLRPLRKGRVESLWLENTPLSLLTAELIGRSRLLQQRGVLRTAIQRTRDGEEWHVAREPGEIVTDERGFRGERITLEKNRKRHSKRLWVYRRPPKAKRWRYSLAALDQINEACKAAGAQYVLVNIPEHPGRYDFKHGQELFDDYHRRIRAWADEHGVPFLDITDANPKAFADDANYTDYHHMHKDGARRFTAQLAERFVALLQRGQGGDSRVSHSLSSK